MHNREIFFHFFKLDNNVIYLYFVSSKDLPQPVLDETHATQDTQVQSDQMKIAWRYQHQNKFEVCKIRFQYLVSFVVIAGNFTSE